MKFNKLINTVFKEEALSSLRLNYLNNSITL